MSYGLGVVEYDLTSRDIEYLVLHVIFRVIMTSSMIWLVFGLGPGCGLDCDLAMTDTLHPGLSEYSMVWSLAWRVCVVVSAG